MVSPRTPSWPEVCPGLDIEACGSKTDGWDGQLHGQEDREKPRVAVWAVGTVSRRRADAAPKFTPVLMCRRCLGGLSVHESGVEWASRAFPVPRSPQGAFRDAMRGCFVHCVGSDWPDGGVGGLREGKRKGGGRGVASAGCAMALHATRDLSLAALEIGHAPGELAVFVLGCELSASSQLRLSSSGE